jgi:16S rRNA (guanine966-N2)-methyltransferase
VRQAVFDMLVHAEWGGRAVLDGAVVLDAFAGTGALGLEALSRGAASACFIEWESKALKALRANVAACGAGERAEIVAGDLFGGAFWTAPRAGRVAPDFRMATLVFIDPPYRQGLVPRAVARLQEAGRLVPGALVVAETEVEDDWAPEGGVLAERRHGAARVVVFRASNAAQ